MIRHLIGRIASSLSPYASHLLKPGSRTWRVARGLYHDLFPVTGEFPVAAILDAFAGTQEGVFFVQIGANDGLHNDPLHKLVKTYAWRGLLVEPVPYVFERLERNYRGTPGLVLENVAVAAKNGALPFYHLARTNDMVPEWYDQLGSFSLEHLLRHAHLIPNIHDRIVKSDVPCKTLATLFAEHRIQNIDLLHVDAEGWDYEIIKQIDLDTFHPNLILYEHRHLTEPQIQACKNLLAASGYQSIEIGPDTLCLHPRALAKKRLQREWMALLNKRGTLKNPNGAR